MRDDPELLTSVAWAEHPLTIEYINSRVSGDGGTYWIDWAAGRFQGGVAELGLSLGSGSGYIERRIIDRGLSRAMEGVDISEEAIRIASGAAGERPITYRRMDLNRDTLEEGKYDFVVSAAALHHVTNLEHLFAQLNRSLKEGGLLIMHEYVGPDRFQWSEEQLDLANRVYDLLPASYKLNRLTGNVHDSIGRRPIADMIQADPSEAVRSSEIQSVASRFFETMERRDVGGSLLHPLLEGIIGNFHPDDTCDTELLKLIIALEKQLVDGGTLPVDFVVSVHRKKKPDLTLEEAMSIGNERSAIISRQEKEILELNDRLVEADRVNRKLSDLAEENRAELEGLRRTVEALSEENAALKSEGPFRALRFIRAKLRHRSR